MIHEQMEKINQLKKWFVALISSFCVHNQNKKKKNHYLLKFPCKIGIFNDRLL